MSINEYEYQLKSLKKTLKDFIDKLGTENKIKIESIDYNIANNKLFINGN